MAMLCGVEGALQRDGFFFSLLPLCREGGAKEKKSERKRL